MAKKIELANPDQLDSKLQSVQLALVPRMQSIMDVETDAECDVVVAIVGEAKSWTSSVEKWFEPMVKAAHATHKALTSKRAETIKAVSTESDRLQGAVNKYLTAKRRRLEAQAIEESADERKRIAQESAEQVQRLAEQGHHEEVMEVLESAREYIGAIQPEKIAASSVSASLENMSAAESCEIEITDGAIIPRQFLVPDERAILAFARANKGAMIPGVRVSWVVKSRIGRS